MGKLKMKSKLKIKLKLKMKLKLKIKFKQKMNQKLNQIILRLIPITTSLVKRLLQHEEIFLQNIEPTRKLLQNQNQNPQPTDPNRLRDTQKRAKIRAETKIS